MTEKKKTNSKKNVSKEQIDAALVDFLFGTKPATTPGDPTDMVRHAGQYNIKELVENFNELDMGRHSWGEFWKNKVFADAHTYGEELKSRRLLMLDNASRQANEVASRNLLHVPTHDFAFSRIWTFIDELAASLSAKTGVQQDVAINALVGWLVDKLSPIVQESVGKTVAKK